MTTKKFYALIVALVLLFASVMAGGCGGSSGGDVQLGGNTSQGDTTTTQLPDMSEVFDSPEFEQIASELEQELIAEGIDPETFKGPEVHFVMILSDDAVYLDGELSSASAVRNSGAASAAESISSLGAKLSAASDDTDMRQEYLFQSRRYVNFIKWTALLNKRAAELDAGAVAAMYQFRAAADSSANFLDISSQNFDGDAGYFQKKYQPLYSLNRSNPNDLRLQVKRLHHSEKF